MEERRDKSGVQRVLAHQCCFGLRGANQIGKALVEKLTYFLTNCPALTRRLASQFCGGHWRATMEGAAKMFADCAMYPLMLCAAIVQGARAPVSARRPP